MIVDIINKSNNELPSYAHDGDAGMDLRAELSTINAKFLYNAEIVGDRLVIHSGGRALVPTELYMAIPNGYWLGISSRSGLALKQGVCVGNPIGVIDSSYRNSVGVILHNYGFDDFVVNQGDRVAQAILFKCEQINWNEVTSLDETDRNLGGFGSSGVK